jgi:hypothetical protein
MTDARTHTSFRFPKFSTPGTGGLLGWAWACAELVDGIAARPNANRNRAPSPAARPMEHRRRVRAEGRGKKTTPTHTPTRRCPSQVLALGSGSVCWHFSHPSIHQSIGVSQSVGRQCPRLFFLRGVGPKEVASPSLPPSAPCFFQRSRNRFPGYPVLRAREIGRSGWRFVQEIGTRITASIH